MTSETRHDHADATPPDAGAVPPTAPDDPSVPHDPDAPDGGRASAYTSPVMRIRIAGFPLPYFLAVFAVVVIAAFTNTLPSSMVAGFAVTILTGRLLTAIGDRIPVLRDYGLAIVLCTFAPSLLIFIGLMPENVTDSVSVFLEDFGFLDFFVVAVIAGSLFGMPRKLLMKAGPRYLFVVIGCITATLAIMGVISAAVGYGFLEGILFIAAPVMAGGLGVGAVPMAEMYSARTGGSPGDYMGDLLAVVAIANMLCIIAAGALSAQDKRKRELFRGFNGRGQLMRAGKKGDSGDLEVPGKSSSAPFTALGTGLVIAGVFFILGEMLAAAMPFLHSYAWTILVIAAVKILGLFPKELEQAGSEWGDMLTSLFLPALLVSVSITYINMEEVVVALTDPRFIGLVIATVLVAGLIGGVLGWLCRFHFVEASVVTGLAMADSGGSGDVAVLGAAKRMHLLAFAALTTRLGGAYTLTVTSLIVPFLA